DTAPCHFRGRLRVVGTPRDKHLERLHGLPLETGKAACKRGRPSERRHDDGHTRRSLQGASAASLRWPASTRETRRRSTSRSASARATPRIEACSPPQSRSSVRRTAASKAT